MNEHPTREILLAEIADIERKRLLLGERVVELALTQLREKLAAIASAPGTDATSSPSVAKPIAATSPALTIPAVAEGERKLVTIMFADASGFTAMSEHADPETIRDLLNRCFDRLVPIVERYGGSVDKFIGDAIMALFGAPAAHEDDAERALRAALDMIAELSRFNAEQGVDLGIHFGINTGVVIAGDIGSRGRRDYSVIGDAVNVAARLEDLSKRGEIFVGPDTWRLTRHVFEFEALESIPVKGREAPVSIYKLLGLQPRRPRATPPLDGMVGRDAELARIHKHVAALRQGRSALVLVSAAAGIGKSRLIAEARASMQDDVFWLEGRANWYSTSASYGVALDLLFNMLDLPVDADSTTIRQALRDACTRLLPTSAEASYAHLATLFGLTPEDDVIHHVDAVAASTLKTRIAVSFDRLVHAAACGRRLVLCLEDAHWMDEASLDILDQLARSSAKPVLILLTARPEGEGGERLKLLSYRINDRITLDALDREASAALARQFVGAAELSEETWDVVFDRAEGNPFYLEELLRSLLEAGADIGDPANPREVNNLDLSSIPPTLRGIVMARLDRLPVDSKRTLQTASVLGRVFQLRLLARIAAGDLSELERQLSELEDREFLNGLELQTDRAEFEYIFKHAVTQEVSYTSLLLSRRGELHLRSAQAIEVLFADRLDELASTVAMHFARAGEAARACHYNLRAARRASAMYARGEARALYQRTFDLLPTLERSDPEMAADCFVEAQLGMGELLKGEARYDEAQNAFMKAHAAARRPELRAAAHRRYGLTLMARRQSREALAYYEKACAELGAPGSHWTADTWDEQIEIEIERLWAHYWLGESAAMRAIVTRADTAIAEHGRHDQKSRLFRSRILISLSEGNLRIEDTTLDLARESLEFAKIHTNADDRARAHLMVAICELFRGNLVDAESEFLSALRLSDHTGNTEYKVMAMSYLTLAYRMQCDRASVAEWAKRSLTESSSFDMPLYAGMARANQAWLALDDENGKVVREMAGPVLTAWRKSSFQIFWIAAWPLLAAAIVEQHWEDAREPLAALLEGNQNQPSDVLADLLKKADTAFLRGDKAAAAYWLRAATPLAREMGLA